MKVKQRRETRTRLIQSGRFVVAVPIEVTYPIDQPDEPCYGPDAVKLIKEVSQRAESGDVDWLKRHGTVYERLEADGVADTARRNARKRP